MVNPRTSPEFWDAADDELDVPLHYPNATRRRALIAHVAGVIGVLATLGLGVAAFGPRASSIMSKARAAFWPEAPAPHVARPVPQVVPLANSPPPAAEPAAAVPETVPPPLPAAAPPEQVSPPAEVIPQVVAPPNQAAAAEPVPSTTAPEAAAPQANPSPGPAQQSDESLTSSKAPVAAPSTPARSATASSPHARTEPRLTWREIEQRKQRYADWLKAQGLEPVH